jgi:hypothetical protein
MRLWLKDSERLADPAPIATDDRAAILVGTALWLLSLVVVLIVGANQWWMLVTSIGAALGLLGLVYNRFRRRATAQ